MPYTSLTQFETDFTQRLGSFIVKERCQENLSDLFAPLGKQELFGRLTEKIFSLFKVLIFFFLLKFLFFIGVQPINNVVIVSGQHQRDSAIHTRVSILSQTPPPSRLPHNTEQSSMCYTIGTCWLFILNIAVCTGPSTTP